MDTQPAPLPTDSAIQAAISLLADSDRRIVATCRETVLAWGEIALPFLSRAARDGEPRLRARARELLRTLEIRMWQETIVRFAEGARRRRARRPAVERTSTTLLEEGALLVSALLRPDDVDRESVMTFVERESKLLLPQLTGKTTATGARLLAEQLAGGGRLVGEPASLFESDHVQIDRVVAAGRGAAVTLGVLYLLVARSAGLEATAVVLPEHFLVRVHGGRPMLIDPAHEGRLVTKGDCMRYLRASRHGIHAVSYLEDVCDLRVLATLLRALQCVFGYREDREVCIAIEVARKALLGPEL